VKERNDSIVRNCEYSFELDDELSAVCHMMRVLMMTSAIAAVQFFGRGANLLCLASTRARACRVCGSQKGECDVDRSLIHKDYHFPHKCLVVDVHNLAAKINRCKESACL